MTLANTLSDPSLLDETVFTQEVQDQTSSDPVHDPATQAWIAAVPRVSEQGVTQVIEQAQAAFPDWAGRTAKERANILRRWFDLVIAAKEDLALVLTTEQGKPLAEARGEIEYAASFIEYYAEEARRVFGEIVPAHLRDARILVSRQPIGVVAAITPWNFPAGMVTRKVAPALAAGCPVVLKPAVETPLTALALAQLAWRAGVPREVFAVVTGDAQTIGGVMTAHPHVKLVTFTGSTRVGKLLMEQSASTVKKMGLELGGNAPFLVFDDADLDAAVEGAISSKFRNMGQTCICANRFLVQADIHDRFVERFAARIKTFVVGDGRTEGVTQGPLITQRAVEKVERHIADATLKGATLHLGGKRHALGGTFFEPTLLTDVTQDMLVCQEETFGPVAAISRFETEEEALTHANDTPYGLAAYVYTRDIGRIFRVSEGLEYGMVGVNTGLISTEVAPFGGVKESGLGREGSHHGIEEFLTLKYTLLAGLAL